MKSTYLTSKNFQGKVAGWCKKLKPYQKHRKSFCMDAAALVIIDMQNYFLDPASHAFLPSAPALLPTLNLCMEKFRGEKRPVYFTRFAVKPSEEDLIREWWGESVVEGCHDSQLDERMRPLPGEKVIRKIHYNALHGTDLLRDLRAVNIDSIVIGGVLTNLCCESTARAAFEEGFKVYILIDGTASVTEEMHFHSLQQLSYGFATPVLSTEL